MDETKETPYMESDILTKETPYMESDILTKEGKPYEKKGACVIALTQKKLRATHEPVAVPGGFIGRKVDVKPKASIKPLVCNIECRVTRTNVDPDNAMVPISVTVNDRKNKREFSPGTVVKLSKAHIDVLRNSVEETKLVIPGDSGIYESKDPLALARSQYPDMIASYDQQTGEIICTRRVPNYVVEVLS